MCGRCPRPCCTLPPRLSQAPPCRGRWPRKGRGLVSPGPRTPLSRMPLQPPAWSAVVVGAGEAEGTVVLGWSEAAAGRLPWEVGLSRGGCAQHSCSPPERLCLLQPFCAHVEGGGGGRGCRGLSHGWTEGLGSLPQKTKACLRGAPSKGRKEGLGCPGGLGRGVSEAGGVTRV